MRVILGSSYPVLLERLTEEILSFRKAHPLEPELVVVPSFPLVPYLEAYLAKSSTTPLMNLQILPAHLLVDRLCPWDIPLPRITDRWALALLTRLIISQDPAGHSFAAFNEAETSLLRSIHDLLDAGLHDPDAVRALIDEPELIRGETERTTLLLFARWLEEARERDLWPASMAAARMTFPLQYARVHLYGFVSMKDVYGEMILRLCETAEQVEVIRYHPLASEARKGACLGYEYSKRILDEEMGVVSSLEQIDSPEPSSAVGEILSSLLARRAEAAPGIHEVIRIVAAPGRAGEVEGVAREIVRLLRETPYCSEPERIAVLGRNMESYLPILRRAFKEMEIPVRLLGGMPAFQRPAVQWILSIFSLLDKGYPAFDVSAVLGSPCCKNSVPEGPDWILKLERRFADIGISHLDENWSARMSMEDRGVQVISAFVRDIEGLSGTCSVKEWIERLVRFLDVWMRPDLLEDEAVIRWLRRLESFYSFEGDEVGSPDPLRSFTPSGRVLMEVAAELLRSMSFPAPQQSGKGVLIGSVEEALGMAFDVVFILGMNRGVFPKAAQEDSLLPDRARSAIAGVLGYPVKVRGEIHGEEKLLFVLSLLCARKKLWLFYRFADEDGSPQSESILLPLIFGAYMSCVERLPAREEERLLSLSRQGRPPLSAREGLWLAGYENGSEMVEHFGLAFSNAMQRSVHVAQKRYDDTRPGLFDLGIGQAVGKYPLRITEAWGDLEQCPYRFFLKHVLGLHTPAEPPGLWWMSLQDIGLLVHRLFQVLFKRGVPSRESSPEILVDRAWESARQQYLADHPEEDLRALVAYGLDRLGSWILPLAACELGRLQDEADELQGSLIVRTELPVRDGRLILRSDGGDTVSLGLALRVDRLDLVGPSRDGARVGRVVDYKIRGSINTWRRDFGNLQLFLYSRALFSQGISAHDAEYVEIVAEGRPEDVITLSVPLGPGEIDSLFEEKAGLLYSLWSRELKVFPFAQDTRVACVRCEYARYCRRYDRPLVAKSKEWSREYQGRLDEINAGLKAALKPHAEKRFG